MSTLWTPGGEVPVDRNPPPPDAGPAVDSGSGEKAGAGAASAPKADLDDLSPEEREQAEQMIRDMAEARERLLSAPAAAVVANHGMGLYELAALHLTQQPPNFSEAVVAIDAMGAVTGALAGRLGDAEATLNDALGQIRKAYVQLKSQTAASGEAQAADSEKPQKPESSEEPEESESSETEEPEESESSETEEPEESESSETEEPEESESSETEEPGESESSETEESDPA